MNSSAACPLSPDTLMRLMWLASPALAVGGFSYSEGLESAVEQGWVFDESTASAWLVDQMYLCQAKGDWSLVAQAITTWSHFKEDELQTLNQWVLMTRETHEFTLQCVQMGRSLLNWLKTHQDSQDPRVLWCSGLDTPTWPIVYALALYLSRSDVQSALVTLAFGWAENMAQTAMKTIPLGQIAGQKILNQLVSEIPNAIELAIQTHPSERQLFSPHLSILSSLHEHQYSRLFRS
jgi:urease accessory protein